MEVTVTIDGKNKKRESLKKDDSIIENEENNAKEEFLASFKRSVAEAIEINKGRKKGRRYKTIEI